MSICCPLQQLKQGGLTLLCPFVTFVTHGPVVNPALMDRGQFSVQKVYKSVKTEVVPLYTLSCQSQTRNTEDKGYHGDCAC